MSFKGKVSRLFASVMAGAMLLGSGMTYFGGELNEVHAYNFKSVVIDKTHFPDPNFRKVVSEDLDRNKDGILDSDDILYARNIWCDSKGIKSLKGIEYLVELRGLYCMNNKIKKMDLSHNKLLIGVWCSDNQFTSLDFTPNPNLEWVYCYNCKITSLNIKNNPKISYVEANSNPLKKLDVSNNPLLEHLMCGDCGLKTLDLKNNPRLMHLDAFRNKFKKLDLSNNPKLKRLDIWDNHKLGNVEISHLKGLQYYNCSNSNVTKIDVSQNPELNKLICSYNRRLKKVDVSNNPKLVYLDCNNCNVKSLDISNNPLLRFLQVFTNPFKELSIGNNPYLLKTYKEGKKETNLPNAGPATSWTIDYKIDDSTSGDSKFFLCFDNKVKLKTTPTKKIVNPYNVDDDDNVKNWNKLVTREMAVQTLYLMAGKPDVSGLKTRFKDVEKGSWYEDAIIWGESHNICVGYPFVTDDTFGVGKYLTRQDMALMLMRYSEVMGYKRSIDFGRSDDYLDYYEVDFDHWEPICWVATWHIFEGKGKPGAPKEEQKIDPYGKVTRSDFKSAIKNLFEVNSVKSNYIPVPDKKYAKPKKDTASEKSTKEEKNTTEKTDKTTKASDIRSKSDISPQNPAKISSVEKSVVSSKSDKDIKGSTFSILKAKGTAKSSKSIKLTWKKVKGAEKYVIYGNKCGKKNKYKKLATVKGNSASYTAKKLKKGTYYKFIVVAVKGDDTLAASKTIHVASKGGKYGNYSRIKLSKTKLSLKSGKSKTIKAVLQKGKTKVKNHRKVVWESDNLKVAKVNKKGRITAVGKGNCYVYAYAQNGMSAKIRVTVK